MIKGVEGENHDSRRGLLVQIVKTDSPYLSPQPVRGRPNQPSHLAWTAQHLAQILGLAPAELAKITTANAQRLFRLPEDDTL